MAIMEPHYMLKWWKKCPICGYCAHDPSWFPKSQKELILKNKMMKVESFLEFKLKASSD
jgi:hypothetical protein